MTNQEKGFHRGLNWTLNGKWRAISLQAGSTALVSDQDYVLVKDERASAIVQRLAKGQRLDDLAALWGEDEVAQKLEEMERMKIALRCASETISESSYWIDEGQTPAGVTRARDVGVRLRGTNDELAASMAEALKRAGVRIGGREGLVVTVVDDYLDPGMSAIQEERLLDRLPWLLVRPVGERLWIGPILIAGVTACGSCLMERLEENRWVEREPRRLGLVLDSPYRSGTAATREMALQIAAHEVERYLVTGSSRLKGSLLELDPRTLRLKAHRVERLTNCPSCRGLGIPPLVGEQRGPVVSHHTGFLRHAQELTPKPDWPVRIFGVQFMAPKASGGVGEAIGPQWAIGRGRTVREARRKAIFEAIERRSSYWHGDEPCLVASLSELGGMAVDPRALLQISALQYETGIVAGGPEPFDESRKIEWRAAWDYRKENMTHVPAALCHLGHPRVEQWSPGADSNGCAAGESYDDAAARAMLEVIEREAAAIWWYGKIGRPCVRMDLLEEGTSRRAYEYLLAAGLKPRVFDITTDWGVPVYAATVTTQGGFYLSFGCAWRGEDALRRAISELYQTILSKGRSVSESKCTMDWQTENGEIALRKEVVRVVKREDQLRVVCSRAAKLGLKPWFLDLTRPEYGASVVRAVVPGAYGLRPSFAPGRLYEVPFRLGWVDRKRVEGELNPDPLPL